jgi:hypothetical protein
MRPERHGRRAALLPLVALLVAATGSATRMALAVSPDPDAPSPTDEASLSGSFDAGEKDDAAVPAPVAVPSVELAGGANGAIAPIGEAWTTWRYGRSGGRQPVDETTTRLRVSGSGRSFDGLIVGFSVGVLAPALHVGAYASKASVAAAWARRDRIDVGSEIEWDTGFADAGTPAMSLSIVSTRELSHTSERRGGVTVDVTYFRVHGALDVTLPCTRSAATFRRSCRPETIRGTF